MGYASHEYISKLGDKFMSWHTWAYTTLTAEELKFYDDGAGADDPVSPEKDALHKRWIKEQQITCHVMYEDGIEIGRTYYEVE